MSRLVNLNGGPVEVIFFDLDNTLYPNSSGIDFVWKQLCMQYIQQTVGVSSQEAIQLTSQYHLEFGLTIKGLVKHHSICPIEFTNFIENGLPYEERIQQDSELEHLLTRLKCKKWIFTNANINHTRKTLSLLGVLHLFDGVTSLDLEDPHLRCKPDSSFFDQAMQEAQVTDPSRCVFVDDSINNIRAAKQFGWNTVFVNEDGIEVSTEMTVFIDHQIERIHQLEDILPREILL